MTIFSMFSGLRQKDSEEFYFIFKIIGCLTDEQTQSRIDLIASLCSFKTSIECRVGSSNKVDNPRDLLDFVRDGDYLIGLSFYVENLLRTSSV